MEQLIQPLKPTLPNVWDLVKDKPNWNDRDLFHAVKAWAVYEPKEQKFVLRGRALEVIGFDARTCNDFAIVCQHQLKYGAFIPVNLDPAQLEQLTQP